MTDSPIIQSCYSALIRRFSSHWQIDGSRIGAEHPADPRSPIAASPAPTFLSSFLFMPQAPIPQALDPARERVLLITLAGIQFAHILDFMIMMPLGPILMRELGVGTHEFGLLVSAYTFTAAFTGVLAAVFVISVIVRNPMSGRPNMPAAVPNPLI